MRLGKHFQFHWKDRLFIIGPISLHSDLRGICWTGDDEVAKITGSNGYENVPRRIYVNNPWLPFFISPFGEDGRNPFVRNGRRRT